MGTSLSPGLEKPGRIVSVDPATGEPLGDVRIATREDVEAAVARARAAAPRWAALPFAERAAVLRRANDVLLDQADEVADLISRENGKTVTTAMAAEVSAIADLIAFFANNAEHLLEDESIPLRHWGLLRRRSYLHYPPLGVVGVISPWNFPFSIPMGTVVMALIAGNTVVLKPSEITPLIGLKIGEILRAAGLPDGCLEIVTGDGSTGAALCEAAIDKMFFTGSGRTGRRVVEACAKRLTPVSLELGGNAPMLVLKDAHIENAVAGAVWGAFFNSGQVCASVQRIYVDRAIAEPFTSRLVEEAKKVRTGVGRGGGVECGAITAGFQMRVIEELVEDAKRRGAKVLLGGKRMETEKGAFYEPTLLTDVDPSSRITKEEIFGPVAYIATFETEDEAVALANDTVYGLMASVWTTDIERGERIARRIESGTVIVNDHAMTHGIADTPWGGVKQSGWGRTHGKLGLLEFVQWRHVHVNAAPGLRAPWWFPEREATYKALRAAAEAMGRQSIVKRVAGLVGAAKSLAFGGNGSER